MMRASSLLFVIAAAACGRSSAAPPGAAVSGDIKTFAWKPANTPALSIVRRTTENLAHDPSGPRPAWVLYDPKGDQVVFVGDDAGYARALAVAKSYDVATAAPPPPPIARDVDLLSNPFDPPPAPPVPSSLDITVDRAVLDRMVADPMDAGRSARIVPSIKNGVADGFKLYAIRPTSPIASLGLQNGDTIHSVNGLDLSSPDAALEVYQRVKDADHLDVAITRRGVDLTIHYTIK
jgi:general secretion pathway protein C